MRARLRVLATAGVAATSLLLVACSGAGTNQGVASGGGGKGSVSSQGGSAQVGDAAFSFPTVRPSTPIQHVVVIFGENISFDHYFGTYPNAANTDGTPFKAARNTPKVNGLSKKLLTDNPNAYNPKRLTPSQALTCRTPTAPAPTIAPAICSQANKSRWSRPTGDLFSRS